jgi:Predicted signal transduction protein with a C-terminal ATPase domain
MVYRLRKYIANIPLKIKMFAISLFNIILLASIAVIGINISTNSNNRLLYNTLASSLSYSADKIYDKLNTIENMTTIILGNTTIQKSLTTMKNSPDYTKRREAYRALTYAVSEHYQSFGINNINYMELHRDAFVLYSNLAKSEKTPLDIKQKMIEAAEAANGKVCMFSEYGNEHGLFVSRNIRRAENISLESLGTMLINIDIEGIIEKATHFDDEYEKTIYMLFDKNELIYGSSEVSAEEAVVVKTNMIGNYDVVLINSEEFFVVKGKIPDYDWDYICLVSYSGIARDIKNYQIWVIIIIVLSVIFTIVISHKLIGEIVSQFNIIISRMKVFGKNEAEETVFVGIDTERNDEFGLLNRQFMYMVERIRNLIAVSYTTEILHKEAQLQALENQVNPHFLYNTLESVNWRAKAIGEEEISLMVEALGALLRVTLDKRYSNFELKSELEIVQNYVTIQKIRFEERLEYQVTVPKELMNIKVPKLTLQPLVENAIRYAIEESTKPCLIQISACKHEDAVYIYVKNKGSYFEDNLLESLQSGKIKANGLGIGILNIHNRLELLYGSAYELSFYNEAEKAIVRIKIPTEERCEEDA